MKERTLTAVREKNGSRSSDEDTPPSRVSEEFALLMTMCANVSVAPKPATLELAQGQPLGQAQRAPENWRSADETVTSAVGGDTSPAPASSFRTEIRHPELGVMNVTVEAKEGQIRVVFEVTDEIARVAVETQRGALLSSLVASGVKVASVVVLVRERGTAFAHRSTQTKSKRSSSASSPNPADEDRNPLDVVG